MMRRETGATVGALAVICLLGFTILPSVFSSTPRLDGTVAVLRDGEPYAGECYTVDTWTAGGGLLDVLDGWVPVVEPNPDGWGPLVFVGKARLTDSGVCK